ncbi:hypothetical protein GCM10009530_55380 [Microbispora corallina]|uniref:SH3b domain-containing protein n=1 Tax=Microbispora corallina TaxID=83302 RepID=A0ABQ4G706_9ACTN|nr:SH3 domain-containing protein [Microbispora corallina]GIH42859.1 hypothetical protein Mco01_58590 [Microbispora corallina]
MTLAHRIVPAMAACAAAGSLVVAVPPAAQGASRARPEPDVEAQTLSCTYRVHGVRPSSYLHVRHGPGLRYHPVGTLRVSDGRFAGACSASGGWVPVRASGGTDGWAAARYLHRLALAQPSVFIRPSLSCAYRVAEVGAGSFLNVRRGPGLPYHPIGTLRASDGRVAGGCDPFNGWVAVDSSGGRPGWASAHYLRKLS